LGSPECPRGQSRATFVNVRWMCFRLPGTSRSGSRIISLGCSLRSKRPRRSCLAISRRMVHVLSMLWWQLLLRLPFGRRTRAQIRGSVRCVSHLHALVPRCGAGAQSGPWRGRVDRLRTGAPSHSPLLGASASLRKSSRRPFTAHSFSSRFKPDLHTVLTRCRLARGTMRRRPRVGVKDVQVIICIAELKCPSTRHEMHDPLWHKSHGDYSSGSISRKH